MAKKPAVLVEPSPLPKALIFGAENFSPLLQEKLEQFGCLVEQKPRGKYDYVFQFGHFSSVDDFLQKHLLNHGKFLFVETADEEVFPKQKIRILRLGDPASWQPEEAVEKILRTIFSEDEGVVVDARKKVFKAVSKEAPKTPPSSTPSSPLVKKKTISAPVVVQTHFIFSPKFLTFFILIFFLFSSVFFGTVFWYLENLKQDFFQLQKSLNTGNFKSAVADLGQVRQRLLFIQNIYEKTYFLTFPLHHNQTYQDTGNVLAATIRLLDASDNLLSYSYDLTAKSFGDLGQKGINQKEAQILNEKLDYLKQELTTAQKEIEKAKLPFFPKEAVLSFLIDTNDKLKSAKEILPIISQIFLDDNIRIYLVLLQNSMELRPTGGFIGSYGILTLKGGQLFDFKIEDVYTADGQLKAHVDPPLPIRKYLAQPHYFLRDSNFDPDFAASSLQAQWFLQKEMGTTVDGVIGINLGMAKQLLAVTGPLVLPDFNHEEIGADNFYEKTQSHTKDKFFPGSTQKKDFLNSVTKALLNELTNNKKASWFKLLPVVKKAFEEKNILLYLNEKNKQSLVEEKGIAGRIAQVECVTNESLAVKTNASSCFPDYLAVIEANLGVNKANYFVSKSVAVEKKITVKGELVTQVTLSYENQTATELGQGLPYSNYLRLFVPKGSKLTALSLNGTALPLTGVETENYGTDKTSFGFLVKIASGNKGVVRVDYTLPTLFTWDTKSYQFLFQKQAGDKNAPLVIHFTSPPAVDFLPVNFISATSRPKEVYYATDNSVDRVFALERKN